MRVPPARTRNEKETSDDKHNNGSKIHYRHVNEGRSERKVHFPHSLWIRFREEKCKSGELDAAASF